jgi:hypothetical protein
MRKRVIIAAAALGAASVVGLAPQAQASCHEYEIGEFQTGCVENALCQLLERVLGPQNCIQ